MRAFVRTSPNTGVSLPFWLAIPVGLTVFVLWLVVVIYGLIAMLVFVVIRAGVRAWSAHQNRPDADGS